MSFSEWNKKNLKDIVNLVTGKLNSNQAEEDGIFPFFTCAPEPLKINNYAFDQDAVLLAGNNANGVFHLNRFSGKFNAYQRTYIISSKDEKVINNDFIYYQLCLKLNMLKEVSLGTATRFLTKKILDNLEFDIPPRKEMEYIAATLSCLDDKIELNNRMNKNLEEMAQAIFKSWFVDFEPFQEGEFEESELGMIPKGWRVGTIGEIASISSGKRPPLKQDCSSAEIYIPVVGASSIMAYTSEYLFNEKILITGRVGTHGIIQRFSTPCWPSDNTLVIKSEYYEFVYQTLNGVDYKSMNRGSTQPLITQTDLKNINIIIPIESVLNGFEKLTLDIMTIWYENINQNKILSQLRDTLLPKLMSGEIRVPIEEVQ